MPPAIKNFAETHRETNKRLYSNIVPSDGMIRIRFEGYDLSRFRGTPTTLREYYITPPDFCQEHTERKL